LESEIMTEGILIDPKSTALLAMDFQTLIVDGYATDKEPLLSRTARLLQAARATQIMIVYVVVGFRPGYPEVSDRNMSFRTVKETGRFTASDANVVIHPALAPVAGDTIVTKHRVGAFFGTDLEMILRANGIDTLLLTGVATSGVVLSTLRYAADSDYHLLVVKDCCSDKDAEVHRVLTEKVFPRQATVASAEEVIDMLG
jgi:nicotinamidase-related amidase